MTGNRIITDKGLVLLLTASLALNVSSCSTIIKNTLSSTEGGRAFTSFVAKTYDPSLVKETTVKLPYDFYENVSKHIASGERVEIIAANPGWGCPIERYGDFDKPNTFLGKMNKAFDGLAAVVDYNPQSSLEVSAKEISEGLNNISNQFPEGTIQWNILGFSHAGNILNEMIRQDYVPNLKKAFFIASPLNGVEFIFPTWYVKENYAFIFGVDKAISDPSFTQLLKGNEFYKTSKIILPKKDITCYLVGIEHDSGNPFVNGSPFILDKDDKVVKLTSQLTDITKYNGANFGGAIIYKGRSLNHTNVIDDDWLLNHLFNFIKEEHTIQSFPSNLNEIPVIQVPFSGKINDSLLPDMNKFGK